MKNETVARNLYFNSMGTIKESIKKYLLFMVKLSHTYPQTMQQLVVNHFHPNNN